MMQWITAWWRQIVGPPRAEPWDDDPHIRAERRGQHDRIHKANEGTYYEQRRLREQRVKAIEDAWRRQGDVQH